MSIRERIESKLLHAFQPERLAVINESHLHAGHGGHDGQEPFDGRGETHFRVRIVAPAFAGLSRIARHRAVNDILREELAGGVHALALQAAAPGERVDW